MDQERVIGPVQLYMTRFSGSELPPELSSAVDTLRTKGVAGVRLIDAVVLRKNADGTIEQPPSLNPLPETRHISPISKLISRVEAGNTLGTAQSFTTEATTARTAMFRGESLPDPRDAIPQGSNALVLLIEHTWATPFRDAILHSRAAPAGGGWVGIEDLEDIGLISHDEAARLTSF